MLVLTSTLFASANPSVTLQSNSLGYPYTQPFQINVTFSEPVTNFSAGAIMVTNGSVDSITSNCEQSEFIVIIKPITSGLITILIPDSSVKSISTGKPNSASNTLSIMGLDPLLRPSSNFNLTQWSLTLPLPLGRKDNALSIGNTTLNGIPSANTGYTNPPYFFTGTGTGSMDFFAPLNGGTTPNSSYARSELMEQLPGASPTWKLSTFKSNTLSASLLVSQVTAVEKRIVIGQIHDKGNTDSFGHTASNSPLLKLYYDLDPLDPNKNVCNGCVYAQIRVTPAQDNFLKIVSLINNVPLNQIFMYTVTLLSDGTLTVNANNISTVIQLNTSADNTKGWGAQNLYFKAGVYNLETGSSKTTGGAASFYALQVTHS